MCKNLLSVSQLNDHGFDVHFMTNGGYIEKDKLGEESAYMGQAISIEPDDGPEKDWHIRLGHASKSKLRQLKTFSTITNCKSCVHGKMTPHQHRSAPESLSKKRSTYMEIELALFQKA